VGKKRENTLLIFTSDNGGSTAQNFDRQYPADTYPEGEIPGNNQPLRGQKGDLYEGGIRVAAVVSWPGRVQPGKYARPMHIVDWMPTLCAIAGYHTERDLKWDGMNVWPHLTAQSTAGSPRLLYWTTPRARAVRDGDWKLIVPATRGTNEGKAELFDLSSDPNEKTDLAGTKSEQVSSLKQKLAAIAKADNDARVK
jgi:arylsulfatase A-like enzyme